MTSVLKRMRQREVTQTREGHVAREADREALYPVTTQDLLESPEAGRGRNEFYPELLVGVWPVDTLILNFSRTVREAVVIHYTSHWLLKQSP